MPRRKREADWPAEKVYSSSTGVRSSSIGSVDFMTGSSLGRHEAVDVRDRARGRLGPARAHAHAGAHRALVPRVDGVEQRRGGAVELDQRVREWTGERLPRARPAHPGEAPDDAGSPDLD